MATQDKLLDKAARNPNGLRFGDFESLLRQCGWVLDHQTGSHRIWYSPRRFRLPIQEAKNGKAKGYQVRQFFEQHEREAADEGQ